MCFNTKENRVEISERLANNVGMNKERASNCTYEDIGLQDLIACIPAGILSSNPENCFFKHY